MKTVFFTTSFIVFTLTGLLLVTAIAVVALLSPQPAAEIVETVKFDPTSTASMEAPAVLDPTPTAEMGGYVEFILVTVSENGKLLYRGVGGSIDGLINPELYVRAGDTVRIILLNGDGMAHDLFLPDFDVKTAYVMGFDDRTEIVFSVGEALPGSYVYYCTLPGHRSAGQEGLLVIGQ